MFTPQWIWPPLSKLAKPIQSLFRRTNQKVQIGLGWGPYDRRRMYGLHDSTQLIVEIYKYFLLDEQKTSHSIHFM